MKVEDAELFWDNEDCDEIDMSQADKMSSVTRKNLRRGRCFFRGFSTIQGRSRGGRLGLTGTHALVGNHFHGCPMSVAFAEAVIDHVFDFVHGIHHVIVQAPQVRCFLFGGLVKGDDFGLDFLAAFLAVFRHGKKDLS